MDPWPSSEKNLVVHNTMGGVASLPNMSFNHTEKMPTKVSGVDCYVGLSPVVVLALHRGLPRPEGSPDVVQLSPVVLGSIGVRWLSWLMGSELLILIHQLVWCPRLCQTLNP